MHHKTPSSTGWRREEYVLSIVTHSPSYAIRVKLMTGISNIRNYIKFGSDPKATTFANILKKEVMPPVVGKWQLLGGVKPRRFGFDGIASAAQPASTGSLIPD